MNKYMTFCSCLLLIALGTLTVCAQSVSGTTTDENTIRQLIEKHAASARLDDVDGMVSTMHDDAVTRLDDGRFLVGRAENAVFLQKIVTGDPYRLSHSHPTESIRIRFLSPDVAFVDVASAAVSGVGPQTPYFLLFTKVNGKWGVAEVRNGPSFE